MPGLTSFPTFPEDVPTHPLVVVDYQLLRIGDKDETEKLWKAATELGFWYLKNHGVDDEVAEMFDMGRETIALPLEEKLKFEQGDQGVSFGYKGAGVQYMDERGTRDVTEFVNVAKDDALAWPAIARRTYPATVNARMASTIRPFVDKSLAINHFLIDVLNDKLGLPRGVLAGFHRPEAHSGCTARVIRAPPHVGDEEKLFLTAHTDFGSLVLPPGSDRWYYVKPLPGHAICNIGDALNIFSGGILRSNIHRVVPPPKEQAQHERWSLVFFTRPNDSAPLHHLGAQSPAIAAAVAGASAPPGKYAPGVTAEEWLMRRVRAQRVSQYKGAESWRDRRGTEDTPIPEWGYI
ncbi:hypothetical protein GSI_00037 [Ganoderma sinense ZZ0214-1]|uniref:Fe2OG dioxygenase domain-containing protein n=1 Tax=Ganoderma sinense ZZ0214-1 TaxID=1077348 RepID=A0A2G8SRF6_9APHY|nr:hypothetical protein GSI_00037 [Ganoderma sinense ZZ0214-1]